MLDKVVILGGSSKVSFGHGEMHAPIRVHLNGRFTKSFEKEKIPYKEMIDYVVNNHFKSIFPLLDTNRWLQIIDNVHFTQGPGVIYDKNGSTKNERSQFFTVFKKKLANLHNNGYRSNDTSTTVSYYPLSDLENMVVMTEKLLNNMEFKKEHQYIGTDIKVMGKRLQKNIELTICIPFIAKYTPDQNFYIKKLNYLKNYLIEFLNSKFNGYSIKIFLNTRDNFKKQDIYLTVIGSAIESGDEGVVGRGNRSNGVISFTRNMSSEAACGKNPVYHTGKIFTVIGDLISKEIYYKFKIENTVYLTSQMGRDMTDPWQVTIAIDGYNFKIDTDLTQKIKLTTERYLENHSQITKKIIKGEIEVY